MRIESLVPRLHLSGNVIASVFDSQLLVQGDDLGNQAEVSGDGTTIVITPLGDTTLTIDSDSFDPNDQAPYNASLINEVVFYGRGGDDSVILRGTLPRHLFVAGGRGNDRMSFIDAVATGETRITGERGTDIVWMLRSTFHGDVGFDGGLDRDRTFTQASTFNATFNHGDLKNPSHVTLTDSIFKGRVIIQGGNSIDRIRFDGSTFASHVDVIVRRGNDQIIARNSTTFAVSPAINTGEGDDILDIG